MDIKDIKRYAWKGENDQVEFKRKVRHPEKIVKEIVAFANSAGGHLFIGIDDNGTIPGVKHAEDDDFILQKAIRDLCRPQILFKSTIIPISEDHAVIHYHIKESRKKPHFAFLDKNHRYGRAYVRIEDRTIQASREVRTILKHQKRTKTRGFEYGDNEKILLQYLDHHENITLSTFKEISDLSAKKASDVLVTLALNNVIRVIPSEGEDLFVFAE